MVSEKGSPSVVRRQLGRRLRDLRQGAGQTIEDVTVTGLASRTKMWRIEGGKARVRIGDVMALARLYGADNKTADVLLRLAEATNDSGFVEDYKGAVQEAYWLYIDLEADAAVIADYNSELVTGLLQTESYIRAIMQDTGSLSREVIEQRIRLRLGRQKAFFGRPRQSRFEAVLTEGAVRVQVGSAAVMRAQREHLRALARQDGVSIRILPFDKGLHPGMDGPFTILDFDDPEDPSLVHIGNMIGSRYIEEPDHVERFRAEFKLLCSKAIPVEDFGYD
jgi:transcriptional regulator with XRE-family HTH domain